MCREIQIALRPVDPARDFSRVVALYRSVYDMPITEDDFRHAYEQTSQYRLTVAQDETGQVMGFSELEPHHGNTDGVLYLQLIVDPARRGCGIGRALYDDIAAFCAAQAAKAIHVAIREGCEDGMRFAQQRGFIVTSFSSELALDLTTFDERHFSGVVQRPQGIRFTSMAELGNTEEVQRRLYALNSATSLDIPDATQAPWATFEAFQNAVCNQPWFRPAGQLLAIDEATDEWAGMCAMNTAQNGERVIAYNLHTGVDRRYRGRGIALALKVLGIRYAREKGAVQIRTHNHPKNAPMLAINHRLGYRAQPGQHRLEKRLL